jgi:hypothetical protein
MTTSEFNVNYWLIAFICFGVGIITGIIIGASL